MVTRPVARAPLTGLTTDVVALDLLTDDDEMNFGFST
jgi:hypothetical protein